VSAFDRLRDRAIQGGMKLLSDPRFMKVMSHPQAQKLMMTAFQLPGRVEGMMAAQGKRFARRFKLATRDEVERLNATIQGLERSLHEMQSQALREHDAEGPDDDL